MLYNYDNSAVVYRQYFRKDKIFDQQNGSKAENFDLLQCFNG